MSDWRIASFGFWAVLNFLLSVGLLSSPAQQGLAPASPQFLRPILCLIGASRPSGFGLYSTFYFLWVSFLALRSRAWRLRRPRGSPCSTFDFRLSTFCLRLGPTRRCLSRPTRVASRRGARAIGRNDSGRLHPPRPDRRGRDRHGVSCRAPRARHGGLQGAAREAPSRQDGRRAVRPRSQIRLPRRPPQRRAHDRDRRIGLGSALHGHRVGDRRAAREIRQEQHPAAHG